MHDSNQFWRIIGGEKISEVVSNIINREILRTATINIVKQLTANFAPEIWMYRQILLKDYEIWDKKLKKSNYYQEQNGELLSFDNIGTTITESILTKTQLFRILGGERGFLNFSSDPNDYNKYPMLSYIVNGKDSPEVILRGLDNAALFKLIEFRLLKENEIVDQEKKDLKDLKTFILLSRQIRNSSSHDEGDGLAVNRTNEGFEKKIDELIQAAEKASKYTKGIRLRDAEIKQQLEKTHKELKYLLDNFRRTHDINCYTETTPYASAEYLYPFDKIYIAYYNNYELLYSFFLSSLLPITVHGHKKNIFTIDEYFTDIKDNGLDNQKILDLFTTISNSEYPIIENVRENSELVTSNPDLNDLKAEPLLSEKLYLQNGKNNCNNGQTVCFLTDSEFIIEEVKKIHFKNLVVAKIINDKKIEFLTR